MNKINEETLDWSTHVFRIDSHCGRSYVVSLEAVRDDYVQFLVENDGISKEQALGQTSFSDVHSWFMEQFNWSDIDRLGKCVQQASSDKIQYALNAIRGHEYPTNSCKFEESADLVAERNARMMQESTSKAPAASPRRM